MSVRSGFVAPKDYHINLLFFGRTLFQKRVVRTELDIYVFIGNIRRYCMSYTYFFPYKLTIRNFPHTFSKICPKKSFVYHSFQQFIKAYRQKCVPYKIEYNMTFHPRFFFGGVRVANLFILFVL
jgi:hypothetical protein